MWKEAFDGDTAGDRYSSSCLPEDDSTLLSRRVSAASDDSFDASSYVHVDNKLNSKMPKCLFGDENNGKVIENHFVKTKSDSKDAATTKSGKRVIRKRLSMSEFNASRLRANLNNNSNAISNRTRAKDPLNSSSSDNDTLPKTKKRNTDVLSAKIQHLMFEMKRLRQLDREVLRQFLIINDTIEEQKWMVEEKQEAIKRSLSEEGEDPITVNFEIVPEVPEEQEDDEESIQSVLSRQNSQTEIFNDSPSDKNEEATKTSASHVTKDSDLISTSSDSALSMSGGSSTLSSTTSLPVSNRSSSPPTSNLSTTSASSSYIDAMEVKCKAREIISTARTDPPQHIEHDFDGSDIEGYYRMHGSSVKRGSYPLPRQSHSFDAAYSSRSYACDDNGLDSAYSTRRGSTDSDSRDAVEHAMAVRRSVANRSFNGPFRNEEFQTKHLSRSISVKESQSPVCRVQRINIQPNHCANDETHRIGGIRRALSVNERGPVSQRLLQNPTHQRHLARFSMNRNQSSMSFVPIAEQEPDTVIENGRLYSSQLHRDSQADANRWIYPSWQEASQHKQNTKKATLQCPPVKRNASSVGSVGSFTSSSRISSSSITSSRSSLSTRSPTKYVTNEADRYYTRPVTSQEPVWVQRNPVPVHTNNHIAKPQNNGYSLPLHAQKNARNHTKHSVPDRALDRFGAKSSKRILPKSSTAYRTNSESHVLTVSLKPKSVKGTNDAVYNWIQTQDDITYL